MKILAALLLSIAIPGTSTRPLKSPAPAEQKAKAPTHKGGKWYFADNGHAVYCYGPVMIVNQPDGNLQRVATFCRDGQTMVPLKD